MAAQKHLRSHCGLRNHVYQRTLLPASKCEVVTGIGLTRRCTRLLAVDWQREDYRCDDAFVKYPRPVQQSLPVASRHSKTKIVQSIDTDGRV